MQRSTEGVRARAASRVAPAKLRAADPAGREGARRILMLQGPVGRFFRELQAALIVAGHYALRACFDGGDRFLRGSGPFAEFEGHPDGLEAWLERTIAAHGIDTLVLFGDERAIHRAARDAAARRGLDVLCLEEGYLRPGYVTAEWGGTNHNSPLVGTIDAARIVPFPGAAPEPAPVPAGMGPIIRAAILTYGARLVLSRDNERPLFHRLRNPLAEIVRWGPANALVRCRYAARDRGILSRLGGDLAGRYDVVALQVPDDSSLVMGGGGWTTGRLVEEATGSFALAAPPERHLVFKLHPLGRGHLADAAAIFTAAARHGVTERVHCVRSGPLAPCLAGARGFVTITSTSALSALHHGKVVLVLGRSIAGSNGLTAGEYGDTGAFPAEFWTSAHRAEPEAVAHLLARIRAECLIPGDFYHPVGRRIAVAHCLRKLDVSAGRNAARAENRGGQPAAPDARAPPGRAGVWGRSGAAK